MFQSKSSPYLTIRLSYIRPTVICLHCRLMSMIGQWVSIGSTLNFFFNQSEWRYNTCPIRDCLAFTQTEHVVEAYPPSISLHLLENP